MKKHHALACRLRDRRDDYLRFTADWRIPADNNGSERDIRMAKLKQKVSGCLRTLTGARQFCAIRSYLSTAAKHGLQFFDALVMLIPSLCRYRDAGAGGRGCAGWGIGIITGLRGRQGAGRRGL